MRDWKYTPAGDHGLSGQEALRSPRRESGFLQSTGHLLWSELTKTYLHAYHRMRVEGREKLPDRAPFVLVANHASHLDALALAAVVPWPLRDSVFPVAAGDTFFRTPVLSLIAVGLLNAISVSRTSCGSHALADLRQRLVDGPCAYILFPEGTRSRNGQPAPFKHGIGRLVAGTGVPVVPCHLEGTFESLPAQRLWPRPGRIVVRVGTPRTFENTANDRGGWRQVAECLERAVRDLGRPAAKCPAST